MAPPPNHVPPQAITDAADSNAFPTKCAAAQRAAFTLGLFARACVEHSNVMQSMRWLADSGGLASVLQGAHESGGPDVPITDGPRRHVLHSLCDPARPELLGELLLSAGEGVVDALDEEGKSAAALVVRGSSPAQQHCLAKLMKVLALRNSPPSPSTPHSLHLTPSLLPHRSSPSPLHLAVYSLPRHLLPQLTPRLTPSAYTHSVPHFTDHPFSPYLTPHLKSYLRT